MNWGEIFSSENLIELALPVGIGVLIIAALIFLRRFLYRYIRKLASRTKTRFDDILIRETSIPIILWCVWLGIFSGFTIYAAPPSWSVVTDKVIPILFTALGIYTLIAVIMATLKWYKEEICPRTSSSFDDIIMGTLIVGAPVVGGALGLIGILNMLGIYSEEVNKWLITHGPKIGVLTVVMVTFLMLVVLIIPRIIDRAVHNARAEQTEQEMQKRSDTLVSVIVATLQIVLIFMFVIMLLTEMNINVTAVLTGAGVLGLAVGFGAQSLVKDVLAGLFIILENQYRKGDVVKIADASGVVEEINLRRTILRDMDGVTHVVPNGEIRVSSNYTKQLSKINLNISVSYDTDLDKAIAVINRVGKEMAEDPRWSSYIITPPSALRVDNLGDSGIDIKITGDTKPSQQWSISGELRLRLKKAFDKEGIEIPWPHTKVYFGNQPPTLWQKEIEAVAEQKPEPKPGINDTLKEDRP
jgi:moderate conductance mechanosensitive channel